MENLLSDGTCRLRPNVGERNYLEQLSERRYGAAGVAECSAFARTRSHAFESGALAPV